MRERDCGRIELAGKQRPAIVVEMAHDLVRVAYGTTEERPFPVVTVQPGTRQGRRLDLRECTFSYGSNTAWVSPADVRLLGKACSVELFLEMRRLIEEYDASVASLPDDAGSG